MTGAERRTWLDPNGRDVHAMVTLKGEDEPFEVVYRDLAGEVRDVLNSEVRKASLAAADLVADRVDGMSNDRNLARELQELLQQQRSAARRVVQEQKDSLGRVDADRCGADDQVSRVSFVVADLDRDQVLKLVQAVLESGASLVDVHVDSCSSVGGTTEGTASSGVRDPAAPGGPRTEDSGPQPSGAGGDA